jgi:hypothetical protein
MWGAVLIPVSVAQVDHYGLQLEEKCRVVPCDLLCATQMNRGVTLSCLEKNGCQVHPKPETEACGVLIDCLSLSGAH